MVKNFYLPLGALIIPAPTGLAVQAWKLFVIFAGAIMMLMLPVIFSFVAVTGAPKYPATFLVAFLMVISSTLTHYGNGLGPLLMETGYVDKATWKIVH